jgi:hypothetical protein
VIKLAKVLRLLKVIKVMRVVKNSRVIKQLERVAGHHLFSIMYFVTAAVFILHWIACLFYYAASLKNFSTDTWVYIMHLENKSRIERCVDAAAACTRFGIEMATLGWDGRRSQNASSAAFRGLLSVDSHGRRVLCMLALPTGQVSTRVAVLHVCGCCSIKAIWLQLVVVWLLCSDYTLFLISHEYMMEISIAPE